MIGVFTLYLVTEPDLSGLATSSRLWTYVPATSSYALLTASFTANTLWRSVVSAPYDPGTNPSSLPTASFAPTPSISFNYSQVGALGYVSACLHYHDVFVQSVTPSPSGTLLGFDANNVMVTTTANHSLWYILPRVPLCRFCALALACRA
jgi:hypothetical protein